MTSRNVQSAIEMYEAFNRRDLDAMAALLAADCRWQDYPEGSTTTGVGPIRDYFAKALRSFSDMRVEELRPLEAGDSVVVRNLVVATHDGPLGPVAPTGRRIALQAVDILHFDAQGKVAAGESWYDRATTLEQLGLMAKPT